MWGRVLTVIKPASHRKNRRGAQRNKDLAVQAFCRCGSLEEYNDLKVFSCEVSFMRVRHVVIALVVCLLAGISVGQVLTGMISGTVTDSSDAIVPNAAVSIVNADTGVTVWHGVTNESGLYRAPSLPVGRYNVIVALQGFKRVEVSGINLTVDQSAAINITLQPGAV